MNQVEIKRRQIQLCAIGLWLVIIWIFGKSLGDNGIAYLVAALEIFICLWAAVGANVPDTLGKLLRGRNAKGQYKNADKLQKSVFVFQFFVGIAGSILLFVLAQYLAENVLRMPYSRFLIMLMAPAVFLRSVSAVLLGVFRGEGSELPSVVVSILKPLLFLGFGLLFSNRLSEYGVKVSNLLGQEAFTAMYGGVGVVIAMLLAELLVLVFLLLVYKGSSRSKRKKDSEGMRTTDSFGGQVYVFYGSMGASILMGILLFLPVILGFIFFQKSISDIYLSANSYGVYVGKYLVVCGVVIALLAAAALPIGVKAASMFRKDEYRNARYLFQSGLKAGIVYSLLLAVLFTVMASQLAETVSQSLINTLSEMFTAGSGIIVFGTVAYYIYNILKLSGRKYWIIGCIAVADMVYAIVLALGFGKNAGDIMVLVYGGLVYSGLLALLLCVAACLLLRTGLDWLRIFAIPIGCACATGLVSYLLSKALTPHLGGAVTFIAVFVLSWMLYLALIVFLRCFGEQETTNVPGGRIMRGLGQLLGVF